MVGCPSGQRKRSVTPLRKLRRFESFTYHELIKLSWREEISTFISGVGYVHLSILSTTLNRVVGIKQLKLINVRIPSLKLYLGKFERLSIGLPTFFYIETTNSVNHLKEGWKDDHDGTFTPFGS